MCQNNFSVYRHTAPNGKMYVGITSVEPNKRWRNGKGYVNNELFMRAIQKYGWHNFKHEILLKNLSQHNAELAEKIFIAYWDLTNSDNGYNILSGGKNGYHHSEKSKCKISKANMNRIFSAEHRKKLSESAKRRTGEKNPFFNKHHSVETKNILSQKNKGRKLSMETRLKMSQSHKGQRLPKEVIDKMVKHRHKKAVKQIDINTNETIKIFDYIADAERQTGITHIRDCCKGRHKTAGGYKWEYVN